MRQREARIEKGTTEKTELSDFVQASELVNFLEKVAENIDGSLFSSNGNVFTSKAQVPNYLRSLGIKGSRHPNRQSRREWLSEIYGIMLYLMSMTLRS